MKRLHVHLSVRDLDGAVDFYSTLFDTAPTVRHADYAKWMLDDPRVNFAISSRAGGSGLDHLGIQVEGRAQLDEVADRLRRAGTQIAEQHDAACCYARSDKAWVADPAGIAWETFHSFGESTEYGGDAAPDVAADCCAQPTSQGVACC